MSDLDRLRVLRAQLEDDNQFVQECAAQHAHMIVRASRSSDAEMASMAVAYLLHNLYTAIEGYFLRVAKHFENNLDDDSWHRDLIDRMRISIPDVRPSVITADLEEPLQELRRFRHLFRNLYKSKLKPNRVDEISESAGPLAKGLLDCHRRFVDWIDELIDAEG